MCGICGIYGWEGDPEERARRLAGMTAALAHRGPDDEGSYADETIGLGFRRLSVIDLETGQQPIRNEAGAVIVLNGEIYNYRELRRELEPRHTFRSKGDVEVVLRLWAEQGVQALARLNGMFALAIWDPAARTLWLARDRFGIKPLFVRREGRSVAFASELTTLLAGGFPEHPELNRTELRHHLYQKYPSPEGTIVRGIRSLPPATVLQIGPQGERELRYWEPPRPAERVSSDAAAVDELGSRLGDAARRQLVADVPVGLFLSGGLDSGTLATLVRPAVSGPLRTFSVGFESSSVANELRPAARLARRLGAEHHELMLDAARVAADLPAILSSLDGPLGDATAIPTWYMSLLARRNVTVALSGEGADELFGGYDRQRFDVWMARLGPLGRAVAPTALALAGRAPSARLRRRLRMPTGLFRQLDWSRVFTAEEIDAIALEPLSSEAELRRLHEDLARRFDEALRIDPVQARLDVDRQLFLVGDLLPKVDRMSMAHSLEVRVPYLDNDLADFILAQPGSRKVRGRQVKWLLRRFAATVLPQTAADRRKQGFDVPISEWQRGPLREIMTDYLSEPTLRRRGLFRPDRVGALVAAHLGGQADHGAQLWQLMALEGWMQGVLDRPATVRVR